MAEILIPVRIKDLPPRAPGNDDWIALDSEASGTGKTSVTEFATAAQGALADTALQDAGAFASAEQGVPSGGAVGQVLTKTGAADYAADWQDPSSAYVLTRAALALVDPATHSHAYLLEDGRQGHFKRVNTVAYAGWIALDTQQGVFVQSTADANFAWMRTEATRLNVKWFGAVANGEYDAVLEGYNGTDDTAAVQAAIDLGNFMGLHVYAPSGNYRFARKAGANSVYLTVPNVCDIIGDGIGKTVFLIDHDHLENTGGNKDNWFFGSATANGALAEAILYDRFTIKGLTIRGLWDYWPGDHRVHVFRIRNFRAIVQANMRIESICGNSSFSEWNESWSAFQCEFARVALGAIKSRSTPNQLVMGCRFEHIDDDVIDSHVVSTTDVNAPVANTVVISGNYFADCEGILLLGGSNVVVSNNVMRRMKSAAIVVSCQTAETGEGAGTNRNVLIANNIVEDTLRRANTAGSSDLTPTLPTTWQAGQVNHIQIGGGRSSAHTTAVNPGTYNPGTGAFIRPYDTAGSLKAGFMHVIDTIDEGADPTVTSGYGSSGFIVAGNTCRRTLPAVSAYSDWGFGLNFTRFGWVDLAVTDSEVANRGITLVSQVRDARIEGNIVDGCLTGFGIGFHEQNLDHEYERVVITKNTIRDCRYGIGRNSTNPASTRTWDVEISDNLIDCDPYHQQIGRTVPRDGSWTNPGATLMGCVGIYLYRAVGLRVLRNRLSNCHRPWVVGANADWYTTSHFEANELRADFAADNWSASNKGIGVFYRGPHDAIRVATYVCDPTLPAFNTLVTPPVLASAALPNNGFFFQGQFVRALSPTFNTGNNTAILGFLRLTTGTGHTEAGGGVAGDWETVVSRP